MGNTGHLCFQPGHPLASGPSLKCWLLTSTMLHLKTSGHREANCLHTSYRGHMQGHGPNSLLSNPSLFKKILTSSLLKGSGELAHVVSI